MKERVFIIGDVHGCYKTLCALIEKLPNKYDEKIIFVGDLIDRGPSSAEVVELIRNANYDVVLGNHEELMIEFLEIEEEYNNWWIKNGGDKAIHSYKQKYNESYKDKMKNDVEWMTNLPVYLEYNLKNDQNRKLVVSHSSINNYWANPKLSKEDIIWNRKVMNPHNIIDVPEIFNVFGHTIFDSPIIRDSFACIDTGAFKGFSGELTAIEFPSMKIYKQEYKD